MEHRLGKFVNDSSNRYSNCRMQPRKIGKKIHLCLLAKKRIPKGTELRYTIIAGQAQILP